MMQHIVYDVCVYEYLNANYPNIIESMLNDEFYIIQDKVYDVLYHITYYGEVVGFVTGNMDGDKFIVEMVYILSKFRSLGFFVSSIDLLEGLLGKELYLFLPNHYAILSLVEHNRSLKLNDDLILSDFRLCFYSDDKLVSSRIYDIKNCRIVCLKEKVVSPLLDVDVFTGNVDTVFDDDYFESVKENVLDSLF